MAWRSASAHLRFGLEAVEGRYRKPRRGFRIDRPMRNPKRPRACIEERPREPGQRFGAGSVTGNRIARRQHHPIGVELQLRDFAGGQKSIVEFGRLPRNAQHQRRFGKSLDVAGDETMGREIDDA